MKFAAPLLRGDGELHVVGSTEVVSLADPDGALHRLIELADGSRSTRELFSALVREYPRIGHQDVVDAVSELEAAGIFERCTPAPQIHDERDRSLRAVYL